MRRPEDSDAELATVPLSVWIELNAGVLESTLNRCSPPIPGELRVILFSLVRDMQSMTAAAKKLEARAGEVS